MKKNLMLVMALTLTACNAQNAVSTSDSSSSGSSSGSGSTSPAPATGSIPKTDQKTLLQTNGCTASKGKGGGNINCGDGTTAFIANGSPFRLKDADQNYVGDYLMSINSLSVWDAAASSAVNYDPNTGYVTFAIIYYQSSDCSGQGYVPNQMLNTAVRDINNVMYKVSGPIASVQFNSISGAGGNQCDTGNPGALVTSGRRNMGEVINYPNTSMPVKINLPAAVVMADGQ